MHRGFLNRCFIHVEEESWWRFFFLFFFTTYTLEAKLDVNHHDHDVIMKQSDIFVLDKCEINVDKNSTLNPMWMYTN